MKRISVATAVVTALMFVHAQAQKECAGTTLAGTVRDSTHALIVGAEVTLDQTQKQTSDADGGFRFSCVAAGSHSLSIQANSFGPRTLAVTAPRTRQLDVTLRPEVVSTQVEVTAGDAGQTSATASGPTETISGDQLQSLADDPDDLLRELQQLGASLGGSLADTTIAVDGFQGASKLPPKSSIAYIRVNPDLFSAEYRQPPFGGGRVEVYTKPGQKTFHGALFATNGSPWENARDPFSTSKGALGNQRYGFELTGPVRKTGSDFVMTLEHRSIDDVEVVNAVTLDSGGNPVPVIANVPAPQRLWVGMAQVNWQLGAKNTFIASYSANVNHLENVGVGGAALPETGYDSFPYEHMFRLSDVTAASAHFMHEARVSLRWDGEADTPVSSAPEVEVAGAFTGGGASRGPQREREFNVEADDDAILTTEKHTLKFGTQLMVYDEHQQLTSGFNGTYTFGGGTAPVLNANGMPIPGETETITGLEQYRRALLDLPGGNPTAFSNVAGTPAVNFTQVQDAVYVQDDWNPGGGFHVAAGLRYSVQNSPTVLGGITPRIGILWSPGKKSRWTIHAHWGMFSGIFAQGIRAEVLREDGVARVTSTIYSPIYGDPFSGTTPIHSIREFSPHISNSSWGAGNFGGTGALSHGWNLSADYFFGRFWNDARSLNVNSPLNGSPTGPRPGAPDLNVLQVQNSGQGRVNAEFIGVEQHKLKRVQLFFGGVRLNLVDDTDDNPLFNPQSSFSNAGEFAHRTGQPSWILFGNGTINVPGKLQLGSTFHAGSGGHYNITTGFDNNGDGNFNDRPQYAAPGTPGAISTPFGLLVASGGNAVFPRNKGEMPWTVYLDTNLQRSFHLTRNEKAEHPQTLTVNIRSSNVLNHENVTAVGGVLSSPFFTIPNSADNGRRVEAGLRYSF